MDTRSRRTPGGMPALALAMLLAIVSATASQQPQLDIHGSLGPAETHMTSASGKPQSMLWPGDVEQAGGGFVLTARLHDSPAGCVNDTIFRDGFEPQTAAD